MGEPIQARAQRTRVEILAAAERRFALQGFAEARLADIGADAGVGRSVVLYHFEDKRGLYRAVLDAVFGPLTERVRRSLAGSGTLLDRIENAVGTLVDYTCDRPASARIALLEAGTSDPELRAVIQDQAKPLLDVFTTVLEEGVRTGEIQPISSDPFRFLSAISGAVVFYVAALPTFVTDVRGDHLAPARTAALKRDALAITRRLLCQGEPCAVIPIATPTPPAPETA